MSDEKDRPQLPDKVKTDSTAPTKVQQAVAAEAIQIENQLEQVESIEVAENLSEPDEESKQVSNQNLQQETFAIEEEEVYSSVPATTSNIEE